MFSEGAVIDSFTYAFIVRSVAEQIHQGMIK